MTRPRLDDRTAGVALLCGYFVVVAILYRDPAAGFALAVRGAGSALYFLVFPALGLGTAGYAILRGSYSGSFVFLAASYLGVLGVTLSLGGIAPGGVALAGAVVFALSVLALVISLRSFWMFFGVGLAAGSNEYRNE